jgi:mono/diheme cytochrome c family protein
MATMIRRIAALWLLLTGAGCTELEESAERPRQTSQPVSSVATLQSAARDIKAGKQLFSSVIDGVENGRSCATCHAVEHATTLQPEEIAQRPSDDPLFNAIDADDPNATPLTFNNLKAGLVRISVELPENVDLLPVPPAAALFTPPQVSASILAQWQASIVPGTRLGDPMPPDLDLGNGVVIHFQPEIITPPDRKISVWRAVPSVANTAYTSPYQSDASEQTLEAQAFAALQRHGQLDSSVTPADLGRELEQLAAFQASTFSDSVRAPYVARQVRELDRYVDEDAAPRREAPSKRASCYAKARCGGQHDLRKPCCDPQHPSRHCLSLIPDPEKVHEAALLAGMSETEQQSWRAGKIVYDAACAACHGTATDDRVINRTLHDAFFLELDASGNITYDPITNPDGSVRYVPRRASRPSSEALNIGATFISHVGQVAGPARFPLANNQNGVTLPQYRLRFYERAGEGVAARSVPVVDLPPLPVVSGGAPFTAAADPNRPGALIVGPAVAPQLFSTDPGRALITGDWADFEAFDVPQLRGVARTAPYFHDNSQTDLPMLIDSYSRLILPLVPGLDALGPTVPAGTDRLSPQQKADLLTSLKVF